jgi:hypothetical protein
LDLRALAGQPVLEGALPPAQGIPGVTIKYRSVRAGKPLQKTLAKAADGD